MPSALKVAALAGLGLASLALLAILAVLLVGEGIPDFVRAFVRAVFGYWRGWGSPPSCPPGKTRLWGLVCSEKCAKGETLDQVTGACWAKCPDDMTDSDKYTGAEPDPISRAALKAFRGVAGYCVKRKPFGTRPALGKIPTVCPESHPDKEGGLCYRKCPGEYKGVGPVCWARCPEGMGETNVGAACWKPKPYGRGTGHLHKHACEKDGVKCDKVSMWPFGHRWYPKCRDGYHAFGCCVCSPDCGPHMTDAGALCIKKTQTRGAGELPGCAADHELVGRLCYPKCPDGFKRNAVGRCSQTCPDGTADLGLVCKKTPTSYKKKTMSFGCRPGYKSMSVLGVDLRCVKTCDKGDFGLGPLCVVNWAKLFSKDNFDGSRTDFGPAGDWTGGVPDPGGPATGR